MSISNTNRKSQKNCKTNKYFFDNKKNYGKNFFRHENKFLFIFYFQISFINFLNKENSEKSCYFTEKSCNSHSQTQKSSFVDCNATYFTSISLKYVGETKNEM